MTTTYTYIKEPVPMEEAKRRALAFLQEHTGRPMPPSKVASAIWPGHWMKAQGAGLAASAVLHRLEQEGKAQWVSRHAYDGLLRSGSGWVRA